MSSLKEEQFQILKMVETGTITSEEGVRLLEALEGSPSQKLETQNAKWLKIRVYEPDDKSKVNVTIPLSLVNVGMKIATKVAPNFVPELKEAGLTEQDIAEIFEAVKDGATGKLIDIESDNGEKVEITIE